MTTPDDNSEQREGFVRRHWRLVLVSFIGWSLLAAIPVTSSYLGAGAPGLPVWWAIFTKIGLYYYLWGIAAPFLYRLTDRLPFKGRGLLLTVPVHVAVMFALSFTFGFAVHAESWQEWLFGERSAGYHAMSIFTYALIVLCSLAIKFYRLSLLRQRQASDARIHAAQLDNQLNLARVDSLRMQMNPHFLFNALNSVAALIESGQKERAYEALELLADLLRQSLSLSKEDDISVEREIGFCRAYLSMEKIRFGDRIHVVWNLDDGAMALHVPAFILQPCVENAIKHAVSLSPDKVTIRVAVELGGDVLDLSVTDDGVASARPETSGGLGIANLRERLRLRYGQGVDVETGRIEAGYRTRISIPTKLLGATLAD